MNVRNFSIIAHVDHGKSTLADRILEKLGAMSERDKRDQTLDTLELERERGITIKSTPIRLEYTRPNGEKYTLNLIDTPGHVDFNYEVSRSLAACEGVLLLVDASQGVEAQTIVNAYLAIDNNLEIVPVINKIDLPAADPDRVAEEIENLLMIDASEAIRASAKEGIGIVEILESVVRNVPPPIGDPDKPLRGLIFDSHYDGYLGVVAYVRVKDGSFKAGDKVRFMATGKEFVVDEVGVFTPSMKKVDILRTGETGYLHAAIKSVTDCRVGDTVTVAGKVGEGMEPLPGYKPAKPMVFCGLYPIDSAQFPDLREALSRMQLNDAALSYEAESSAALGFGFRCGFLGLLHMEIVQERLEREFNLELLATAPSVIYKVFKTDNTEVNVDNPANWPAITAIQHVEEPYVDAMIIVPTEYVGTVMEMGRDRRGEYGRMEYPAPGRVMLHYQLPLAEIVMDFFDQLKSRTKGYASFDYELSGYKPSALVKLDVQINGEDVDSLSFITHRDKSYARGKILVEKLKELLPRQQFEIKLQAAVGNKVIAAERISALRKNVIAKCYGGDISRKRKLLEKQKEGKKRMKSVGNVEIPQEAFMSVLRLGD